jgi:hypothetical protein
LDLDLDLDLVLARALAHMIRRELKFLDYSKHAVPVPVLL